MLRRLPAPSAPARPPAASPVPTAGKVEEKKFCRTRTGTAYIITSRSFRRPYLGPKARDGSASGPLPPLAQTTSALCVWCRFKGVDTGRSYTHTPTETTCVEVRYNNTTEHTTQRQHKTAKHHHRSVVTVTGATRPAAISIEAGSYFALPITRTIAYYLLFSRQSGLAFLGERVFSLLFSGGDILVQLSHIGTIAARFLLRPSV